MKEATVVVLGTMVLVLGLGGLVAALVEEALPSLRRSGPARRRRR